MSEGLQLHRALLAAISPHLENKDKVTEVQADIRDLVIQIHKVGKYFSITLCDTWPFLRHLRDGVLFALQMMKMVLGEAVVQPTPTPVTLSLPGDYEVQVAAHLTLVQLQSFGQDMVRCLRSLDQSNEDTESWPKMPSHLAHVQNVLRPAIFYYGHFLCVEIFIICIYFYLYTYL